MQGTILSQIAGTSLRSTSYAPQRRTQPATSVFGAASSVTGSTNPNPTTFGAASTPSYLEASFKTSLTYRPPAIRTPNNAFTAGIGFFGSSALGSVPGAPSGQPPIVPPPVGYFQYQGSVTYFDVLPNGTEYYITQ